MMNSDDEWDLVQGNDESALEPAKSGVLRISLLFGSIAVAFALFLVPIANRQSSDIARANVSSLDLISTGATSRANEYTIRKSVLQSKASSECILRSDGSSVGDC
ncbi:MAG: hypothetical protein ACRCU5_01995 [Rhizobiaceae bacterium]